MKKWLVMAMLVTLSTSLAFSQEKKNDDDFLTVQVLINQDLDDNFKLIQSKADNLSSTQRLFIYDDKSKSGTLPFILNLFLGFGIGSWVQNDITGGLIGTLGMVPGVVLMAASPDTEALGALLILGSWITDLIRPWTFSSSYNTKLKEALRMSDITDIMILPTLNVAKNNLIYPGASLRVQF